MKGVVSRRKRLWIIAIAVCSILTVVNIASFITIAVSRYLSQPKAPVFVKYDKDEAKTIISDLNSAVKTNVAEDKMPLLESARTKYSHSNLASEVNIIYAEYIGTRQSKFAEAIAELEVLKLDKLSKKDQKTVYKLLANFYGKITQLDKSEYYNKLYQEISGK